MNKSFADYVEEVCGEILPEWQKDYLNEVYAGYKEGRIKTLPVRGNCKSMKNLFLTLFLALYKINEDEQKDN